MLDAISACQVAMLSDRLQLETINQNISNLSTPGYKTLLSDNTVFSEPFQVQLENVRARMRYATQNTIGGMEQTKQPLDLALSAEGYFEVQTEEGIFYTRRGDFKLNEHGEIATAAGAKLLGKSGSLRTEGKAFRIDAQGNFFIDNTKVDQIPVVQFTHPQLLQYKGQGLYQSQELPQPASNARVLQGYLEKSNVRSVDAMTQMIQTSRHFETTQQVLRTANNLLSNAIHQLGEGNV